MIKELFFFACVIGICSSAAITNIQPESEPKILENAAEEGDVDQTADLETAEFKHHGFAPKVVVIKKGFGGYGGGGYGGYGGCGCGSSHYHSHNKFYGKKK